LQKQKIGAELHIYLEEGTYHKRLFKYCDCCSQRRRNIKLKKLSTLNSRSYVTVAEVEKFVGDFSMNFSSSYPLNFTTHVNNMNLYGYINITGNDHYR